MLSDERKALFDRRQSASPSVPSATPQRSANVALASPAAPKDDDNSGEPMETTSGMTSTPSLRTFLATKRYVNTVVVRQPPIQMYMVRLSQDPGDVANPIIVDDPDPPADDELEDAPDDELTMIYEEASTQDTASNYSASSSCYSSATTRYTPTFPEWSPHSSPAYSPGPFDRDDGDTMETASSSSDGMSDEELHVTGPFAGPFDPMNPR